MKGQPLCSAGVQEKGQHGGGSPVHSPPCAGGAPAAVLLLLGALGHALHPLYSVLWSFFSARCRIGIQVPVLVMVAQGISASEC